MSKKEQNKKYLIICFFLLALGGIGLDYFNLVDYTLGDPISNLSLSLIVVCIVLLPFCEQVFRTWLHFAYWAIPVSILATMTQSDAGGGYFPSLITKEILSWWIGGIFVASSLALITWKWFALRKAGN